MDTLLEKGLKKVEIKLNNDIFYLTQGIAQDYLWNENKSYVYRTRVYIEYKGHRTSFFFHGSIHDYNNGKTYYNKKEFPFILYCFLSDAHSGYLTFDNFCSEFGYDTDSRKAEKIYKACERSMEKIYKLGIQSETELCDLLNELNEKYDC